MFVFTRLLCRYIWTRGLFLDTIFILPFRLSYAESYCRALFTCRTLFCPFVPFHEILSLGFRMTIFTMRHFATLAARQMAVQQKNHKTNLGDGLLAQKYIGFCRYATLYIRAYDLKSPCFIHGGAARGMEIYETNVLVRSSAS